MTLEEEFEKHALAVRASQGIATEADVARVVIFITNFVDRLKALSESEYADKRAKASAEMKAAGLAIEKWALAIEQNWGEIEVDEENPLQHIKLVLPELEKSTKGIEKTEGGEKLHESLILLIAVLQDTIEFERITEAVRRIRAEPMTEEEKAIVQAILTKAKEKASCPGFFPALHTKQFIESLKESRRTKDGSI